MGPSDLNFNLATAATFAAVCPLVFVLRLYARRLSGGRLGVDDWLFTLATLTVVACAAFVIAGIKTGVIATAANTPYAIEHEADPDFPRYIPGCFFIFQLWTMGLVKLSFSFFLRRIFIVHGHTVRSAYNILSAIVIVITVAWLISFTVAYILSCNGNVSVWAESWITFTGRECDSELVTLQALSISDFLIDVMVMVLPVIPIWQLQMTLQKKLAVLAVFSLSMLALVASILRLVYFNIFAHTIFNKPMDAEGTAQRFNKIEKEAIYWSMVEAGVAYIACCLPCLHILLHTGVFSTAIRRVVPGTKTATPWSSSFPTSSKRSRSATRAYIHVNSGGGGVDKGSRLVSGGSGSAGRRGDEAWMELGEREVVESLRTRESLV